MLRIFLPESEKHDLLGDYAEFYREIFKRKGWLIANLWYWMQILVIIPTNIWNSTKWSLVMIWNYLKIAYRNIKKHKGYSLINIAGLTVGMACCFMIMVYVQYELSYDTFHEKAQYIFRIQKQYPRGDTSVITFGPLASAITAEYPEVVQAVRIEHRDEYEVAVRFQNKSYYERGFYVDKNFFDMFSYNIFQGDTKTALAEPYSLVISKALAEKYFGNQDPLGKTITIIDNESYDAKITGVFDNIPGNSHLQFDFLASMVTLRKIYDKDNFGETWQGYDFLTYIEFGDNVDVKAFEKKLQAFIEKHQNREADGHFLMPLKDIHLKSRDNFEILKDSDLQNIHFLSLVAYLILVIACINYLNLTTAKALIRIKEIGVRKTLGANRKQLILQFLYESLFISAIALFLAVLLTVALLPAFNTLVNREINIHFLGNLTLLPELIGFVIIVGLLSGIYPAFYITSLQTVKSTSGCYGRSTTKSRLRNLFVTFQFCVSIGLIAGTIIVIRQLYYIKTTDIGYEREHVLSMPIRDDVIRNNLESIKTELLKNPAVQAVSASSHIPNRITWGGSLNAKDNEVVRTNSCAVDFDYVELFDIDIVEGRAFSQDYMSDRNGAFLLSETIVQRLGWESPLGKECTHWGYKTGQVVGIFRDFHFRSLHQEVRPLYLILDQSRARVMFVKIQSDDMQAVVTFVDEIISAWNPSHPFQFSFLDDAFNDMYKSEQQFGKIIVIFSSLAIFVACLGLLGLISFSAEIRTKEIGIRKVLGASTAQVLNQMTKVYFIIIGIAALVAFPISYLLLCKWLRNFAYRIDLRMWPFLLSGFLVLFIAVMTLSWQTVKAATANPVNSLRYE